MHCVRGSHCDACQKLFGIQHPIVLPGMSWISGVPVEREREQAHAGERREIADEHAQTAAQGEDVEVCMHVSMGANTLTCACASGRAETGRCRVECGRARNLRLRTLQRDTSARKDPRNQKPDSKAFW